MNPEATPTVVQPKSEADLTGMTMEQLLNVQVVFAASKSEQKASEAPANITIITSQEIQVQGYRTMNDLLRSVRDFYITDDRSYSYIGVRGFGSLGGYNNRILLLVDGHRINDAVYDSFMTGQDDMVDMGMVDRVEIIRGPGSALYGSSAFFAVINVITKQGKAADGLTLTSQGGSLGSVKEAASYGGTTDSGFHWLAEGSYYGSAGHSSLYFPYYDDGIPADNNGLAQNVDAEQAEHAYLSLGTGDWTLRGAFYDRLKTIPVQDGVIFNDPGNTVDLRRTYGEIMYQHNEGKDLELLGHASVDYSYYVADSAYAGPPGPARYINYDTSTGTWCGADMQAVIKTIESNKLSLGGEFRDNFQLYQANYDVTGNYLDDNRQSTVWALYAQDEVAFTEGLHLTAGCRYDDYSTSGGQFNPRAALIWEPTATSSLKVMAGSAFRAPNAYELYYSFPNYEEANTSLTPETVQTYDFEWDQAFGKIHQFSLSLFRYTAQNLIVNALDTKTGLYDFQNLNKASANGIGAEYQIHTSDGVLGRLSYTYQRAQDDATGDWLSDSPQVLAKASLQVPVIAHLSVAGELQYSGTSLGYAGDANSPYALVNLKVSSQGLFLDGLDANFAVYNLFDTAYSVPVNFTSAENMIQDGLMVWGSLSCKL